MGAIAQDKKGEAKKDEKAAKKRFGLFG